MIKTAVRALLVANAMLVTAGLGTASAQYYPAPGYPPQVPGYPPPPPPGYPPPPPPGYPPPPGGPYGGGYGPRPGGPYGGGYGPRPAVGFHCMTSRGVCETGYPSPLRGPCRCDFGFERKRGQVVP